MCAVQTHITYTNKYYIISIIILSSKIASKVNTKAYIARLEIKIVIFLSYLNC